MSNTVSRIISDETLSRIIQIESAGNPNAKAKTSSATGLGQFIESTWMSVVQRHRPDLMKGRTRADVLALRCDPSLAVELLARFTEDNAAVLGRGYGDGDLYLAHFAGVGTARKILQAFAATPVNKIVAPAAINANPSILRGKTCAEVREWANKKMAAAGSRDWVGKWYRGKPPAEPQKAVSAGQGAVGAAAIVGTATATTAAHQGLGAGAWLAIGVALLLAIGAAYLAWRWWRQRKARKVGVAAMTVALDPADIQVTAKGGADSSFTVSAPVFTVTKPPRKRPRQKPAAKRKSKRKAA